jgi:cell division protein YceG involved in septum cleavage
MIKKLFSLFVLMALVVSAGLIYVLKKPLDIPSGEETISIQINQGQTLSQLAYNWENQGWLPSALYFLGIF